MHSILVASKKNTTKTTQQMNLEKKKKKKLNQCDQTQRIQTLAFYYALTD